MRPKAQTFVARRAPRHPVERLHCGLGRVVDLSRAGMRIACESKPPVEVGQRGAIKLTGPDGALPLTGRVVWIRRTGAWRAKKHEIGIEFVAITEPMRQAVELLAQFGFIDPAAASASTGGTSGGGGRRWRSTQQKARRSVRVDFDLPNYYQMLGVEPDAEIAEIKKAYRKLARLCHPDVAADGGDPERFTQITEAVAVLSDPQRRKSFDKLALTEEPADAETV
jgi:hypothetical protein